jgi:SUN domain-containing protein 1/2
MRERPEDTSLDIEQGMEPIAEDDGNHERDELVELPPPRPAFSIGAFLGKGARLLYQGGSSIAVWLMQLVGILFFVFGVVFGTALDLVIYRPLRWIGSSLRSGTFIQLGKYITVAGIVYAAWYLRDPLLQRMPTRNRSSPIPYHAPDVPAANIAELASRLRTVEIALSGLAQEQDTSRTRLESESRGRAELGSRLGSIEVRLQRDNMRVAEAEAQVRQLASQGLPGLREEIEVLVAQVQAQGSRGTSGNDEEARAKVMALEERIGGVEGGMKEALEVARNAAKTGGAVTGVGAAWWNKLAAGSTTAGLTIKSADGEDVTALIGHLVDTAVSKYGKDALARPDFAMHSAGARIVPSLTSPTFEMSPQTMRGMIVGLLTGNGYAIGRPPITALHHELHNGYCWPFAGSKGQLGVALAAPTIISDVTIDHVAKEVAFDMRSAPREMEVWGMVEGRDNIARVREWQKAKERQLAEARTRAAEAGVPLEAEEIPVYPRTLPKSPQYVRIASFSYDIHSPNNIQTFPVSQEIHDLGVDFGIVVLVVKSNWGRTEFTCLYRLRVHGQRAGEMPPL